MSSLFTDRLGPEQQKVFHQLKAFSPKFILAGGTAMMLQIGHRLSYDFDCFSLKPIKKTLLKKAIKVFGEKISVRVNNPDLLIFQTQKKIEVTFVYFPYIPLKKRVATTTIALAHSDDLVANKAYVIGRRGTWRDYVDLFFALKWKVNSLGAIIKNAKKKLKAEFNDRLFLDQLVYYGDSKVVPIKFLQESYTESQIKGFLEQEVRKYLKKILK